ncbi:MAG TPA: curlin [Paracoccus sp.]|nr:curlin [Paracoccus sp. (in: a-proteobacteria)]
MKPLILSVTLAAAAVLGAMVPLPATAGGTALVLQVSPSSRGEARLMRHALSWLAAGNAARVSQQGSNNSAAISQRGRGSTAIIAQQGDGHTGTIAQHGNNHAYGLFQFGEATGHHVTQQGRGRTGMTLVIGF